MLQEINDFCEIFFGFIIAGNLREDDFVLFVTIETSLALTKSKRLVALPLGLAEHKEEQSTDQQNRDE